MKTPEITALILAGGLGTRLRGKVDDVPKVLAKVAGRPFLEYLLDQLMETSVNKVVLCTGYMAENISGYFGNRYRNTLEITYSREEEPLGTGGALRLAVKSVKSDVLMVMNGDSYINADLNEYMKWYAGSGKPASLLLTEVNNASRYGKVTVGSDDRVISFNEKNTSSEQGLINAGIYIMKKSLLKEIPLGTKYSLEYDYFPKLVKEGSLYGFRSGPELIDIGTPESYVQAQDFFSRLEKYKKD